MGVIKMHFVVSRRARRSPRFLIAGVTLLFFGMGLAASSSGHSWDGPLPPATECQPGIGGHLFSNGGDLEVELLAADAGFTIELYMAWPAPQRLVATNRDAGKIVKFGSIPSGVELLFSVFVRETQKTYLMGSGSANPDGLPHAEVTCFGDGRSNIGFEDQMGGGDKDYNDLVCTVRQPKNTCAYSVNPRSQSFDAFGGGGTLGVAVQNGCSWSTKSNVNWITVTSTGSGSDNGMIKYSVAVNPEPSARTGTLTVQGETFTVSQDAAGARPVITSTLRKGSKKIFLYGVNFDGESVILLNGDEQKTLYNSENPGTVLLGKKLGKRIQAGDTLQVKNALGVVSLPYIYVP